MVLKRDEEKRKIENSVIQGMQNKKQKEATRSDDAGRRGVAKK